MVALLIDRPRIRTGYGLLERRGLRRVGVINRIGGNVRGSVHLSGLGLGTHSASPPDVGLPRHNAVGQVVDANTVAAA